MYSKEIKQEIKRLYESGYEVKEIADKLKTNPSRISHIIRAMRHSGIKVERWWK